MTRALRYEDLSLLYFIRSKLRSKHQSSHLIKISRRVPSPSGDVDRLAMFSPDIKYFLQAKSHQNLENLTLNRAMEGILQLYCYYRQNISSNKTPESYFILISEGEQYDKDLEPWLFGNTLTPSHPVKREMVKKILASVNQVNNRTEEKDQCYDFLNVFSVMPTASLANLKETVEASYGKDLYLRISGFLGGQDEITDIALLELIHKAGTDLGNHSRSSDPQPTNLNPIQVNKAKAIFKRLYLFLYNHYRGDDPPDIEASLVEYQEELQYLGLSLTNTRGRLEVSKEICPPSGIFLSLRKAGEFHGPGWYAITQAGDIGDFIPEFRQPQVRYDFFLKITRFASSQFGLNLEIPTTGRVLN